MRGGVQWGRSEGASVHRAQGQSAIALGTGGM